MAEDMDPGKTEEGRVSALLNFTQRLIGLLPKRAQYTTVLAILLAIIGFGSFLLLNDKDPSAQALIPFMLILLVAVSLLLYAVRQAASETTEAIETVTEDIKDAIENEAGELRHAIDRLVLSAEERPPGYAIGCRIGRGIVEVGSLCFSPSKYDVLPRESYGDFVSAQEGRPARAYFPANTRDHTEIYDAVANAIIANAEAIQGPQFEYIGLGLPGLVNPRNSVLYRAMTGYGFSDHEHVKDDLARRLCLDPRLRTKFNAATEAEMRTRIFADNDVRCASRALLATRLDQWEDFACLHIGTGVGMSFVLGGQLHYGSRSYAGEIGHATFHLGEFLDLLPRSSGAGFGTTNAPLWCSTADSLARPRLHLRECSCGGKTTFHLETLINYSGLTGLAEAIDPGGLNQIRLLYREDRAEELFENEQERERDFIRNGVLSALETAFCDGPSDTGCPSLHRAANGSQGPQLKAYLTDVIDRYASIMAIITGSVVNMLDLEGFVFCGSLIERLGRQELYVSRLTHHLRENVIGRELPKLIHGVYISDLAWRGAALIGRDPRYPGTLRRTGS